MQIHIKCTSAKRIVHIHKQLCQTFILSRDYSQLKKEGKLTEFGYKKQITKTKNRKRNKQTKLLHEDCVLTLR